MADGNRPAKRVKIDSDVVLPVGSTAQLTVSNQTNRSQSTDQLDDRPAKPHRKASSKYHKSDQSLKTRTGTKARSSTTRTFSQPSVICSGDKGIFVTCDKGCEKKALLELHDILQDYLDTRGVDPRGEPTADQACEAGTTSSDVTGVDIDNKQGIEADIESELAGLRDGVQSDNNVRSASSSRPMQLITLDIPCVSFLRLPPGSTLDPIKIVHQLCLNAADAQAQQRSRFIKRLTPVSSLAKALSQGLEKICEVALPVHFGPDATGNIKSTTFAIRPTIRENEQLDRDLIIRMVADRVQQLGNKEHKVDLKHYEKGVIVEVYRGWVGMCVVDNANVDGQKQGYTQLKRFNLAEIYASR